jgi:inner membrane protein import complex subunit Tim44-like protein
MRTRLIGLVLLSPLVLAAPALGVAGGATGSGGGGGGGGGGGFSGGGGGFSGGGSGGSSSWNAGTSIVFLVIVLIVFGIPFFTGLVNNARRQWYRDRILRRARKVEEAAGAADLDDGYWEPSSLKQRVREAFFPIQMSWEKRSVEESRPFVSDALYERHRLQLEGYEKQNRANRIADLRLNEIQLVRIYNVTEDGEDRFVAYVSCSARDWMEDTRTGALMNGNKTSATTFEQYWTFTRHPYHGWVLDEIQQGSEAAYHLTAELVDEDEGPRIYERDGGASSPPGGAPAGPGGAPAAP